jgi:lipid-A-disaccharide synthase
LFIAAARSNVTGHGRMLFLLPFEPAFFAGHGLQARFVGHPVLESDAGTGNAA